MDLRFFFGSGSSGSFSGRLLLERHGPPLERCFQDSFSSQTLNFSCLDSVKAVKQNWKFCWIPSGPSRPVETPSFDVDLGRGVPEGSVSLPVWF